MPGTSTSGPAFLSLLLVAAGGGAAFAQTTVDQTPAKWRATLDGCGSSIIVIAPTCQAAYAQVTPLFDASCSNQGRTLNGPNCGVGEPQGPNNATYSGPFSSGVAGQVVSFCSDASNDRGHVGTGGIIFCPVSPYSRLVNAGAPRYCAGCQEGNPLHPATGNKFQVENDYRGYGALPLQFVRYYNSMLPKVTSAGMGAQHVHV